MKECKNESESENGRVRSEGRSDPASERPRERTFVGRTL